MDLLGSLANSPPKPNQNIPKSHTNNFLKQVQKFRQELSSAFVKTLTEKSHTEVVQNSKEIYKALQDFNFFVKNNNDTVQSKKRLKEALSSLEKSIAYPGGIMSHTSDPCKETSFSIANILTWKRIFCLGPRIELNTIETNDPITRRHIRQINIQTWTGSNHSKNHQLSDILDHVLTKEQLISDEPILIELFELGLVEPKQCLEIAQKLKNILKNFRDELVRLKKQNEFIQKNDGADMLTEILKKKKIKKTEGDESEETENRKDDPKGVYKDDNQIVFDKFGAQRAREVETRREIAENESKLLTNHFTKFYDKFEVDYETILYDESNPFKYNEEHLQERILESIIHMITLIDDNAIFEGKTKNFFLSKNNKDLNREILEIIFSIIHNREWPNGRLSFLINTVFMAFFNVRNDLTFRSSLLIFQNQKDYQKIFEKFDEGKHEAENLMIKTQRAYNDLLKAEIGTFSISSFTFKQLSQLLKEMEELRLSPELKYHLGVSNYPVMLLKTIDIISVHLNSKNSEIKFLIEKILKILGEILVNNIPGQACILKSVGYHYLLRALKIDRMGTLLFLIKTFTSNKTLLYQSKRIFAQISDPVKEILVYSIEKVFQPGNNLLDREAPTGSQDSDYENEEDDLFSPSEEASCILLINKLIEDVLSLDDYSQEERGFEYRIQLFFLEQAKTTFMPFLTSEKNSEILTNYKPILYYKSFEEIFEFFSGNDLKHAEFEHLKFEAAVSCLRTFNATCENFKYFEPEKHFDMLKVDKKSDLSRFYIFRNSKMGLIPLTELIKLYTNLCLFEGGNRLADETLEWKNDYFEVKAREIADLLNHFKQKGVEIFSKEFRKINKEFILGGVLRATYKFFKGLVLELDHHVLEQSLYVDLREALQYNLEDITRMLGIHDHFKNLNYILYNKEKKSKGNNFKLAKNTSSVLNYEDQNLLINFSKGIAERNSQEEVCRAECSAILNTLEEIYKFCEESSLLNSFIREDAEKLQKSETEIYDSLKWEGSIGLANFKLKIEERQGKIEQKNNKPKNPENSEIIQKMPSNFSFSNMKNKVPSSHQKLTQREPGLPGYLDTLERFVLKKVTYIRKESTQVLRFMDEGDDDNDDEIHYENLCYWIMNAFTHTISQGRSKDQMAKNDLGGDCDASSGIEDNFVAASQEMFSLLIKDSMNYAWVHIMDNLLTLKPQIRQIFFDKHFEDELRTMKAKEVGENGEKEFLIQEEELDLNNIENCNSDGQDFVRAIFQASIFFQRAIKREIYNYNFLYYCEYYFSLCNMIKNFAEDNFQFFKEFFGRTAILNKTTNENPVSVIDEFYKGVYVPEGTNGDQLETSDRPDLFWYNIVTLNTLSEFFNGPCRYNQDKLIKNYIPLFNSLDRVNQDISNTFYLMQLEVIQFIQVLFEGNSKEKIKRITGSDDLSGPIGPNKFYRKIYTFLKKLYENRKTLKKSDRVQKKPKTKQLEPAELVQLYKNNRGFSEHPIIHIARGLFFIMKSISERVKKYKRYLDKKTIDMVIEFREQEGLEISASMDQLIYEERKRRKKRLEKNSKRNKLKKNSSYNKIIGLAAPGLVESEEEEEDVGPEEENDRSHRDAMVYFNFIHRISTFIEVLCPQKTNVIIHFPKVPKCFFLTDITKNEFRDTCGIDDTGTKLLEMMNNIRQFEIEMDSNSKIYEKHRILSNLTTEDAFGHFMKIGWVLGLGLNILCLLSFEHTDPDPQINAYGATTINKVLILLVSSSIILFSLFNLGLWFWFKFDESKQVEIENRKLMEKDYEQKGRLIKFFRDIIYASIIKQSIPMMFIFQLTFCLFGIFVNSLFITFHLMLLVYLSGTAKYVVKSITEHIDQLFVTLILAVFFTYTFANINVQYYRNIFDDNDSNGMDLCKSLLSCFMYVVDFGLRNGGGIADSHNQLPFYPQSSYYTKLTFNLAFFIFINLIALNIIFGVIIDTFAELRDDQQNRCNFFF